MEENTLPRDKVLTHALKAGMILGLCSILLNLMVYFINRELFVSFWFIGFVILINILYPIFTIINLRKSNGGFIPFNSAFLDGFLTCLNATLLLTVFSYILYNFLDPDLGEYIKEKMIDKTTAWLESMDIPQDQIEQRMAQMENEDTSYGLAKSLKNLVGAAIGYSLYNLLLAAILKKQPTTGF